jgi:hypothetical protein
VNARFSLSAFPRPLNRSAGGLGHTLPYLIPDVHTVAVAVGGVLGFLTGILIGSS